MGCKDIRVRPLSEEESLILFLNKVGPNMFQNTSIKPTLKLVVNECACLPLTIAVVAGTLKGEDDPLIWKNALKELKSRIAKVMERLKFSFNHLKEDKVRECFLYCALYPECWIDEGFIDEMETRKEMEDKGHAILKSCSQGNPIEKIPNAFFANMPHLSVVNLSGTSIESLPNSISGLKNLTALLLQDMCLVLVNLRYLDLQVMSLKEMPTGLLPKFPHLQHLRFDLRNEKTRLKAEEAHIFNLNDDTLIPCIENAMDLRVCTIDNCQDMECIVSRHPFQRLEWLNLFCLPKNIQ
ncbi:hypothetical protein V6N11_006032 [Hibiscus sabdariffa]|uniref:NB-ARC domain-containing protein n=1 Tax=Hibiscus sabdariffa TaxID=183260 RepID=A0ABR2RPV9_9ROSI